MTEMMFSPVGGGEGGTESCAMDISLIGGVAIVPAGMVMLASPSAEITVIGLMNLPFGSTSPLTSWITVTFPFMVVVAGGSKVVGGGVVVVVGGVVEVVGGVVDVVGGGVVDVGDVVGGVVVVGGKVVVGGGVVVVGGASAAKLAVTVSLAFIMIKVEAAVLLSTSPVQFTK